MLAPKCATYNGRSTFANPKYLKIAQSEKPRLYEIPYDTSDPANRFCPNGEETVTLEKESRSKLDKDKVKPYDYNNQKQFFMKLSNHHPKPILISWNALKKLGRQCGEKMPRSSRFKRRLIAADQASVFMAMMFEQRSSSLVLHQMTSDHNHSELGIYDHSNEPSSSKLVPKVVPLAVKTATS
ncbi:hypothetical protein Tco_0060355 [Tanacetum coccineum]